MYYWFAFWVICLTLAGASFAVISLIVLVRGVADLRLMFARLESHTRPNNSTTG